ncbi:MAG: recombination protein RmuC [Frankiales bacterium]|nr:recombination protein RmuC [Frankiales bacterium]
MTFTAILCLLLGIGLGALLGHLWTRNRAALSALAQAQVSASRHAAAADLGERQHAVQALVDPLQSALTQVHQQLRLTERDRLTANAALDEQLDAMRSTTQDLRNETRQLVTALRAPQVRGRWGELQLERAVEAAGMVEHIDYATQHTITGEDGVLRPDLVVNLVGGKHVVVDSKVAFSAYLEAMEARDESTRANRLRAHARQMRTHIDALSAKEYWARLAGSPEFVVCFVPADSFLDAALREDPTLLEHAFAHDVVLATPSTLVALLRTIGLTWRQQAMAENTAEIARLGRELYQRIGTLIGHYDKLGRSLDAAVLAFNGSVGALESRVLVSARRLADLAVVDGEPDGPLPGPEQLLASSRALTVHAKPGAVP